MMVWGNTTAHAPRTDRSCLLLDLRVQLTPDETADLHRTKHLRHLDALRTARMRALSPDTYTDPSADTLAAEAGPWAVVTKR